MVTAQDTSTATQQHFGQLGTIEVICGFTLSFCSSCIEVLRSLPVKQKRQPFMLVQALGYQLMWSTLVNLAFFLDLWLHSTAPLLVILLWVTQVVPLKASLLHMVVRRFQNNLFCCLGFHVIPFHFFCFFVQVSLWSLVVLAIETYIVVCKPVGSFKLSSNHAIAGIVFTELITRNCSVLPF